MIVESNTARFDTLPLDSGQTLAGVEVAYETYGQLNAAKSNAILVLHASPATRTRPESTTRASPAGGTT
jgi:homoserine acetyltransferase